MDLLSQYKQDHPEAFREKPAWEPPKEYGFFIRLVMRVSSGRIRDVNTAAKALAIVGAVVFSISIIIFIYSFSGSGVPKNPATNIDQRQFSSGK